MSKEREFRGPCAGCGRKTPVSQLAPVVHGTIGRGAWWIDKQCQRCAPNEYADMLARREASRAAPGGPHDG